MSILFSVAGSIEPSLFSFWQTTSLELDELINDTNSKLKNYDPVLIQEEGYVGTISNFYNAKDYQNNIDSQKKSPLQAKPGRQDYAFLDSNNDVLVIKGNIKFIDNFKTPTLTDSKEQLNNYKLFVEKYINEIGLKELVKRYILNILSGKIFWRNQHAFRKLIDIQLKTKTNTENFRFNTSNLESSEFLDNPFKNEQDQLFNKLVDMVANEMEKNGLVGLKLNAFLEIGSGAPTYPSQSFLEEKPEGKGRVLTGQILENNKKIAVFSSQKIGNALRTIDTWYSEDATEAIPVEVYGVVVTRREAFRASGKNSFYDFFSPEKFDKFIKNFDTQKTTDKHYIMSMFLKGGVFGI